MWLPISHNFYTCLYILILRAGGLHGTHGSRAQGWLLSTEKAADTRAPCIPTPVFPKLSWDQQEGGLLMGTSRL